MRKLVGTGIFLCFCCVGIAQTIDVLKVDSFVQVLSSRGLAMGSLVIFKDGGVQYEKAFGYAYMAGDQKIPANTQTQYRIGSITKMFTATMVFQLMDEGKLSLATTLDKFFPDLPNAGKITMANLLYHRSGLHDYTHDTDFDSWMDKPKTHEEMLAIIKQKGTDFEPGTKADYCNTNYLLLGYIIEKISKTVYANELRKRITAKLGLQRTSVGGAIDIRENEAASYKYSEGKWKSERETDLSIHGGAGSIVSTTPEMTRFVEALSSINW